MKFILKQIGYFYCLLLIGILTGLFITNVPIINWIIFMLFIGLIICNLIDFVRFIIYNDDINL